MSNDTTHCICDKCDRAHRCKEECQSFERFTNTHKDDDRKSLLNEFLKLQSLQVPFAL